MGFMDRAMKWLRGGSESKKSLEKPKVSGEATGADFDRAMLVLQKGELKTEQARLMKQLRDFEEQKLLAIREELMALPDDQSFLLEQRASISRNWLEHEAKQELGALQSQINALNEELAALEPTPEKELRMRKNGGDPGEAQRLKTVLEALLAKKASLVQQMDIEARNLFLQEGEILQEKTKSSSSRGDVGVMKAIVDIKTASERDVATRLAEVNAKLQQIGEKLN